MEIVKKIFRYINREIHNQNSIFYILLFELMFTNIIMLFTEQMVWAGRISLLLIPLSIQIILLGIVKRPGIIFLILIPKIIIDAFQFVILILFKNSTIAVDMFLNLTNTNSEESGELLSNIYPAIIFLIVFYGFGIFISIISVRSKEYINGIIRKRRAIVGSIILAVGIIFIITAENIDRKYHINKDLYPYNVLYNLGCAINVNIRVNNYCNTSKGFTFNAKKLSGNKNREIIVLILGETERAASYGLLGYRPNTCTPLDSIGNITVFNNVLTQSNTTHKIVPMILSAADASNHELIYSTKSIVTAFSEAGYKTAFITNQKYNNSFPSHYFNEADLKYSIKENNDKALDHEMLPLLDIALAKYKNDNLFIILHLYGSHFNYKDRYSNRFSIFTPDKAEYISTHNKQKLINSYNNSIISTADLVANIIRKIDNQNAESAVIYLSDHGEDIMDDKRHRFLHASPIPTYYQLHIPFICWISEEYIKNHKEKSNFVVENRDHAISNSVVFHSLLDFADISTEYFKPELSICNPRLKDGDLYYLTDRNIPVKVKDLPMHDLDFEQIRQRKIRL